MKKPSSHMYRVDGPRSWWLLNETQYIHTFHKICQIPQGNNKITVKSMHLTLWCLSAISMMFVKIMKIGSVYISGYGGVRENGLRVLRELCPVSFFVVGESLSVLL